MMPSTKSKIKLQAENKQGHFAFEAIGTQWVITCYDSPISKKLQDLILSRIETFDLSYSRFREDSLVSRMAKAAGTYPLPKDASAMLDFYYDIYTLTNGAVTPLIGQTLADAGYDAAYSFRAKSTIHSPPKWNEILSYTDNEITLNSPQLLDFGAAGKGYLVDIIAELLLASGIIAFAVDAGGDIRVINAPTIQKIGLENPADSKQIIGIARIQNQSICGSAGNRRVWANYHHIIDPFKLSSPDHIAAVWVSAPTTMLADGLTTALYFVEPKILKSSYNFEYALVLSDGSLKKSSNFPAEFFVTQ
jgi:thiamine biosynthesis lipoprotein